MFGSCQKMLLCFESQEKPRAVNPLSHDSALHDVFAEQIHPQPSIYLASLFILYLPTVPLISVSSSDSAFPNMADIPMTIDALHDFVDALTSRDSASSGFIGPNPHTSRSSVVQCTFQRDT